MQNSSTLEHRPARDYRLDIIKAISIILVLCWHFQPFDVTAPKLTDYHLSGIFREGIKSFYAQVTLLGVPSFILVSLYLYFMNLSKRGYSYTKSRPIHLAQLFAFWVSCQIVIYFLTTYSLTNSFADNLTSLLKGLSFYKIFIEGGPRLNFIGGGSVFYYFTTLFFSTILATFYFFITTKNETAGAWIGALTVISSLIYFEYCSLNNIYVELLDLRTFIIYIPLAYYLWSHKDKFSIWLFIFFIVGYVFFAVQDYYLRRQGFVINVYLRTGITFGASMIFYGVKNLSLIKESKTLTFFSIYSLGIYATHKYFQYFSTALLSPYFELYKIGKKTHFGEIHINLQVLSIAALGISLTLLCVFLLGKTRLKGFVKG
ncbi:MAG: acyltransferase family protein [Anaerolineales bacterium]|nr:acyltransferase family protein [Anaerolineales bacterium]